MLRVLLGDSELHVPVLQEQRWEPKPPTARFFNWLELLSVLCRAGGLKGGLESAAGEEGKPKDLVPLVGLRAAGASGRALEHQRCTEDGIREGRKQKETIGKNSQNFVLLFLFIVL